MKNKRIWYLTMIGCGLGILLAVLIFWKDSSLYEETSYAGLGIPTDTPSAELRVEKVLQLQLQALQNNDSEDKGIAKAFSFASPINQEQTGPLDHFVELLHNEVYEPLLQFRSFSFISIQKRKRHAQILVRILSGNDEPIYYLFDLYQQVKEPYFDCWMTESVIRLEDQQAKKGMQA